MASGIANSLRKLSHDLPQICELLQEELSRYFWSHGVFAILAFLPFTAVGIVLQTIKQRWFPPSAAELHRSAVGIIHKSPESAAKLLQAAVRRDPSYIPAYYTLAAVNIYRLRRYKAARSLLEKIPMSKTAESLRMDAQAGLLGSTSMLQPWRLQDYLRVTEDETIHNKETVGSQDKKGQ